MQKHRKDIFILVFFFFIAMNFSCSKEDILEDVFKKSYDIEYIDSSMLCKVIEACETSENRNLSVGVFGGSLSCNPESAADKVLWYRHLNLTITTYGHGGHGFSSLQGSIQEQVKKAKIHDIYILWASTNDFTNSRPAGEPTDYTEADGFDKTKLVTQCGGINYCIRKLRQKNPKAKIYLFTSLKFFAGSGFDAKSLVNNETEHNFHFYIEKQKECAIQQNILYLDQFDIPVNTPDNCEKFYKEDKFHLTETGYANIGLYQLYFLATEKPYK